LVYRKAFSAGVSKRWIEIIRMYNTDGWVLQRIELFDIDINHGEVELLKTE
jgi:hypothetical protein